MTGAAGISDALRLRKDLQWTSGFRLHIFKGDAQSVDLIIPGRVIRVGNSNDRQMFRIMSQLKGFHCIGKCSDLPGKIFGKQDHDDNSKGQKNKDSDQ